MKKPADKMSLKFLPGVCSLIRGNAHNRFMAFRTPEISPVQSVRDVPGPYRCCIPHPLPPFFSYEHENNIVTSKKRKTTCQNKQLMSRSLSDSSSQSPEPYRTYGACKNVVST
jgi:hypothetical protein